MKLFAGDSNGENVRAWSRFCRCFSPAWNQWSFSSFLSSVLPKSRHDPLPSACSIHPDHRPRQARREGLAAHSAGRGPYEADAQLAYLARTGYVTAVISEDSDLLGRAGPSPRVPNNGSTACFFFSGFSLFLHFFSCISTWTICRVIFRCVFGSTIFKAVASCLTPTRLCENSTQLKLQPQIIYRVSFAVRQEQGHKDTKIKGPGLFDANHPFQGPLCPRRQLCANAHS